MKKLSLLIILLFSLLLTSCGEVAEVTTPVETTPAATTPTVTTPAATTSAQYPYLFSLTEDGHVSVSKDGNEELSFRLSELEFSSISHPDVTSTYCFDPALVTFCLNQYFPTKIALRLRQREWPAEDAYRIYIDFNDCGFGILYIQKDGQVFFDYLKPYHGNEIDVSYVSEPGACSYENIAKLYTLLDSPEPINDRCDEFADDTDFLYSLQPDEAGNLLWARKDEILDTLLLENLEYFDFNGLAGTLYRIVDTSPAKQELWSGIFQEKIAFRRLDTEAECALYNGVLIDSSHRGINFRLELNNLQSYDVKITPSGQIMLTDSQRHSYISEPGACDGEAIISWAEKFIFNYK